MIRSLMLDLLKTLLKGLLPAGVIEGIRANRALPIRTARLERQVALLAAQVARKGATSTTSHSPVNDHELQVYSQHGEDGILQFVFSEIGVTNKVFVEFGMGDGRECNTAYLSLHCGWRGLLMDGNEERVAVARAYYERTLGAGQATVAIEEAWITAENIDELLGGLGYSGEIDLLSIDLDGIDYWVWRAITIVNPRVLVVEYSAVLGPQESLTVPNAPRFSRWAAHPSGLYAGASLRALETLSREKGYRLVGCNRHGVNAFFVREDVASLALPAVSPKQAYYPCEDLVLGLITPDRFDEVSHLNWETV